MGIHAADNLSDLAHQESEPYVPEHYDYDEYVIMERVERNGRGSIAVIERYYGHRSAWRDARIQFLHMFNVEKRKVLLVGRVFN